MVEIKVKTINKRRYFVAREKGKYIGRRLLSGSKLNKLSASEIFNKNGTFFPDRFKTKTSLVNMNEVTHIKASSIENRTKAVKLNKPRKIKGSRKQVLMYQVSGYINGKLIVANSQSSYTTPARQMKAEAWESFLERVSQSQGGEYDADEGLKFSKSITQIREGWVKYTDKA